MNKSDVIKREVRKAKAEQRVGPDARCSSCGESRPEALISGSDPMICANCQRVSKGLTTFDNHHVAGKNNSPVTIAVEVNDHRARLSGDQYSWAKRVRENPDGDPLIAIAAGLLGFADTVLYLIDKFLIKAAECVIAAADFFKELRGDKYWLGTPMEAFAPKA
jgi:hypothetical protein